MNYHLRSQGQNQGVFPLEELRRRREAGELSGADYVWCEGMPNWQTLDSVLATGGAERPVVLPPPIPAAARPRSNGPVIAAIAAGILVFVGLMVVYGIAAFKAAKRMQTLVETGGGSRRAAGTDERAVVALAGKPVPWNTNTTTRRDVQKQAREFRTRQYLEAYKNLGDRNPAVDAKSLQLIEAWIALNYGGTPEQGDGPSPAALASQLAADKVCTDPLVLTVAAANASGVPVAVRRYERAVSGFAQSKYKAYPKLFATISLADKITTDRTNRQPVLDAAAVELFKTALADGSLTPEDQAEIADTLLLGWGERFFGRNGAAVYSAAREAGPDFKWLALVLEGEFNIKEAWKLRGGGYVNTVTKAGWAGFAEHLAGARRCLTEAWELRPALPLAADRMIYVSLGDSGIEEMRLWFDRAVAAQIDYAKAWSDLRWGLRPRWYGSPEAMLALGVMAVNTRRFDTDVPREFFDVVTDLESEIDSEPGRHIYGRQDIWPHLQDMYEGYIAEPSQAPLQNGWRGTYAVVGGIAGKYNVAGKQLEALRWNFEKLPLTGWGADVSLLPWEVAARTGTLGAQVTQAENARNRGDLAAALRSYTALLEAANTDARTLTFVQDRLTTLELERRLQAGDWVDFQPARTNLPGWSVARGRCELLPDGALEIHSGSAGHLLYSRVRLGNDFEVKGDFETLGGPTNLLQGGLVIGLPEPDSRGWNGFRVRLVNGTGEVSFYTQGWNDRTLYVSANLDRGTNAFLFRVEGGIVSASMNGREIIRNFRPPTNRYFATNEVHLGLGAFNNTTNSVIRYRHLQVHQLSSRQ